MQIDVTTDELKLIDKGLSDLMGGLNAQAAHELREKLAPELEAAIEAESMEFDDCLGGACKL